MTEEEMYGIFQDNVVVALSTLQLKGVMEDVEIVDGEFNRSLTSVEQLIVGYSLVVA